MEDQEGRSTMADKMEYVITEIDHRQQERPVRMEAAPVSSSLLHLQEIVNRNHRKQTKTKVSTEATRKSTKATLVSDDIKGCRAEGTMLMDSGTALVVSTPTHQRLQWEKEIAIRNAEPSGCSSFGILAGKSFSSKE